MVNVRFKKTCISEYSVYFDVNGRNIKRYYVFLDITVSKDYYPLFASHLGKRKNMKISACDSAKMNFVKIKLLEAQLQFAKGELIQPKKAVAKKIDFFALLDEIAEKKHHGTYNAAFKQYKYFCGDTSKIPTDTDMKDFGGYSKNKLPN